MASAPPQLPPRLDSSSSSSSTCLDSIHNSISGFPNAWSQIVPGDAEPPPPSPTSNPVPLPPGKQQRSQQQRCLAAAEAAVLDPAPATALPPPAATTTTAPAPSSASSFSHSAACSPVLPPKQVGDSLPQDSATVVDTPDRSDVDASSGESSAAAKAGVAETSSKVSKPAWRKPVADAEEPGPVMGAVSWPALGDPPSTKSSELPKPTSSPASIQKAGPKPPPASTGSESSAIQGSSSESSFRSWAGGARPKPSITRGMIRNGMPPSRAIAGPENMSSSLNVHPVTGDDVIPSDRSVKGSGEMRMKDVQAGAATADYGRVFHHKGEGGAAPFPKNAGYRRNSMRGQGRGNHWWHPHGNAYGDFRDNGLAPQQQRVGPRNLPPHIHPFMNINPAFIHAPGFYNAGGAIYFMQATAPDLLHGASYYMPPGSPGVPMHGPDPMGLRVMLLKQIEYYFSTENLCSDIYLRSHMDYQGFVPVSLVANFNRVQMLTSKPNIILEALRKSTVVEVQGNRIRRRDDWERWILPSSQQEPIGSSTSQEDSRESDSRNSGGYHQEIASANPGEHQNESTKYSVLSKKAENSQAMLDRADDEDTGGFYTSSVLLSEEKAEPHFWEGSGALNFPEEFYVNMSEGRSSDGYGHAKFIGRVNDLGIEIGSNSSYAEFNVRNGCAHDLGNCSPSKDESPLEESSRVSHWVAEAKTRNLTTEEK